MEFVSYQFNVIVLMLLIGVWLSFTVHLIHDGSDKETVSWAREQATGAQGALLGLITGVALSKRNQDPKP